MAQDSVARLRSFHRTVTQRVGALEVEYLGRGRPLGESRLLWEIGRGAEVRELRRRLGLDSGYVSRLLRSLEAQGLVSVSASADDARVRTARLTPRGRQEVRALDRLSDALARSILEPLDERRREQLVEAAATVERLLEAAAVEIAPEDPATDDARFCLDSYFAELHARFEGGFDAARALPAAGDELRPPRGLLLVARLRGEPVGCGALRRYRGAPPDVKRMWVAPSARGLGVGRRLLRELEREARAGGAKRVRLETNRALAEAIELYRSSGYVEVEPFNDEPHAHHWFEKRL